MSPEELDFQCAGFQCSLKTSSVFRGLRLGSQECAVSIVHFNGGEVSEYRTRIRMEIYIYIYLIMNKC